MFLHEQKATDIEQAKTLSRTRYFWWITYLADLSQWDWLWEPPPWQSHQRHAWSSQHQKDAGVYLIPQQWNRQDTNYHTDKIITTLPDKLAWKQNENIVEDQWDWSWHPDPSDPPYIYVFGNQWNPPEFKASVEYHVPGATERKYMTARTTRLPNYGNQWRVYLPVEEFDYSWEPNPFDPPYIYVFGNQWYSAESEATVEYHVPNATERKYMHDIVARVAPNTRPYYQHCAVKSFDYSWHPDPGDPPYIYVFGNQWWPAETMPTVEYLVPGATERKYMDHPRAQLPERHDNRWHTLEDCAWDYSWVPDPGDPPYIYVFGNQWWPAESWPTVTYTVPGATEHKYMDEPRAKLLPHDQGWLPLCNKKFIFDYSWKPDPGDPPYTYIFGNQWHAAEIMPTLQWQHPQANKDSAVKYVEWPRAELLPDNTFWTIPETIDKTQIDLSWTPDPGEPPYIYQFATQHQKTGGPIYIVPGATETKYLENIQIKVDIQTVPVVEIDHLDGHDGQIPNTIKKIRYFDNYRDTLIRLAKNLQDEHEFVWVCSSICDYSNFDFTWHPEKWQQTMLHVFASDDQKFGDTFYMHVPTFAKRAEKKALLEWYNINFVPRKVVPRRSLPVVLHNENTHVEKVKSAQWSGPLAIFTTGELPNKVPAVNLWRAETKAIVPLSNSADVTIVPRMAVSSVKTQLYDYAYIDKTHRNHCARLCMDIIFISYDEPEADRNWQILHDKFPKSKRVHGIAGMENALEAAANVSDTPWYWAVFAKTELAPDFDFSYMPDYLQQPKHYIFNCFNVVNGLEYGHMGVVLYNCQGIRGLNQRGNFGLDYTLSFAHESVPILSCIGRFNTTPYHTWRTAFRETAKLAFFESQQNTVEGQYRLRAWLEKAQGHNAEWCLKGARDGVDFFDSTNGDLEKLKQSFRWEWLRSYFNHRYGDLE